MVDHRSLDEHLHLLTQWETVPESEYPRMHPEQVSYLAAYFVNLLGMVEVLWRVWDNYSLIMFHNLGVISREERIKQVKFLDDLRLRVGTSLRKLAGIRGSDVKAKPGDVIRFWDTDPEKRRRRRKALILETYDGGWEVSGYGWLPRWWPVEIVEASNG